MAFIDPSHMVLYHQCSKTFVAFLKIFDPLVRLSKRLPKHLYLRF